MFYLVQRFSHTYLLSDHSPSRAASGSAESPRYETEGRTLDGCQPAITLNIPLTHGSSLRMCLGEKQPAFRNEFHLRGYRVAFLKCGAHFREAGLCMSKNPISWSNFHRPPCFLKKPSTRMTKEKLIRFQVKFKLSVEKGD